MACNVSFSRLLAACALVVAGVASARASAELLVQYDFIGGSASPTQASIIASDYVATGGTAFSSGSESHFVWEPGSSVNATIEEAVANDVAGSFTVEASSGALNLTSVDFRLGTDLGELGDVFSVHLRSSLDGFAGDLGVVTHTHVVAGNVYVDHSIELTGAQFQNITGPVTFSLFFVNDVQQPDATGNDDIMRLQWVELHGVPEPASLGIASIGGLLALGFGRRGRGRG